MKVLVVDDSVAIAKAAKMMVEREGHQVVTADNGYRALQALEQETPDLVLLDVEMPTLDGFKTCMLIRSRHTKESLPIVFLTSHGTVFDKAKGTLVGGNDFIVKPFTADRIKNVISKWSSDK